MEVAVVLKSSILVATAGGLVDCFIQCWLPPDLSHIDIDYENYYDEDDDDEDEEDLIDLERVCKIGAVILVGTPLAISTAIHYYVGVPWRFVLQTAGMTEAICAPCGAILWVLDEAGGALYSNFPKMVVVSCWTTFLLTYGLSAFIYHHRIPWLPIISSTGERFPESIVWTVGAGITGIGLIGMARGFMLGYVGQPLEVRREVNYYSRLGYVGGLAMILVGVFASGPGFTNYLHILSAVTCGSTTTLSLAKHAQFATRVQCTTASPRSSASTYNEQVSVRERRLFYVYSCIFCGTGFFACGKLFIVSAFFEYATCFFWSMSVYSFNDDFKMQMVGQPAQSWGSGLGRRISSATLKSVSSPKYETSDTFPTDT